jgi:hypothetical protein
VVDDMIVRHASHTTPTRTRSLSVRDRLRDVPPARRTMRRPLLLSIALLLACATPGAVAAEHASYRTEPVPASPQIQATAARAAGPTGAATKRATTRAPRLIELRASRRFSMVGLRWASARAIVSGELRAQRTDGSWTEWMELEGQVGADGVVRGADGAEAQAGERRSARAGLLGSTEPLWTGPARRLQIRLTSPRPRGLRAAFVDVTGTIPRVQARAAARRQDDGLAGIQPRAAWDPNNECAPRGTPDLGSVQGVVVHHTVGTNDYAQTQVPAIILGICKFHRNGNGWNDIGYNLLVDRFGGAWEGRAGGLTQAVVGAQAQGFNAVTSGISMLGNFQVVAPSSEQLATVGRVAAWRLAVAGVPRTGTVELTSAGGSLARYGSGKVATLPRVMGHRDVGQTECPGNLAYPLLDRVRSFAAEANPVLPVNLPAGPAPTPAPTPKPVKITIATQRKIAAGANLVVKGTATQGGSPLRSATVALQVASSSDWQTVAKDRTTTSGKYAFTHRFSRSWKLRVVRTDGDGGASSTVAMDLVPRLRLTVPKRMTVNKRTVLRGSITPGRGPVKLLIERRTKSGRYVAGSTVPVKLSGRKLTVAVTPHTATLYRFRLVIAASEFNTAGRSPLAYGRAVTAQTSGGASVAG